MNKETIDSIYHDIFSSFQHIELETHVKKLIELDQYYPYNSTYYCITNTVAQKFEYVSKNFTACTGHSRDKLLSDGMNYFWSLFHPEDIGKWLQSLKELMQFTMTELNDEQRKRMSYTWNYRIRNGKGDYVHIIQNTTPLQFDEENKPIIGLAHYTVINGTTPMDICASGKYLNQNNEYETLFYKNITTSNLLDLISNRERDIIRLILTKHDSKSISEKLNISLHTVNTHRRNILRKLGLDSSFELQNYFKSNPTLL